MLRVEKASVGDLDALERLFDDLCDYLARTVNYPGWEKGRYPVRAVAEQALSEDSLYVARRDGAIVGTVTLNHQEPPAYQSADWKETCCVGVVHTLAVHPDALHGGVGRTLMEYAVAWAKAQRCRAIHLDTYEHNQPAKRLYEGLGFCFRGKIDLGYAAWGREWYDAYEYLL